MNEHRIKVAIVGATGLVGKTAFEVLKEFKIQNIEIIAYASEKTPGRVINWKNHSIDVLPMPVTPPEADYALFCAPNEIAKKYAPIWADAGIKVIDNSSAFRMTEGIPLVVPEVNARRIGEGGNFVANPNCSTIQLAVALEPLKQEFGIKEVSVATYQAVSGAGSVAIEQLNKEIAGQESKESLFPRPIHANVIPIIGTKDEQGFNTEERKLMQELPKILEEENLLVNATAARVPIETGHSEAVDVILGRDAELEEVLQVLERGKGIILAKDEDAMITARECPGNDEVFVSRVRRSPHAKNRFLMWVVSDNLRKGAASNAVQIMTHWIEKENQKY